MYCTTNGDSLGFCSSDASTLALFSLYPAAIAASAPVVLPSLNTSYSANLFCISVNLFGTPMVDNLR